MRPAVRATFRSYSGSSQGPYRRAPGAVKMEMPLKRLWTLFDPGRQALPFPCTSPEPGNFAAAGAVKQAHPPPRSGQVRLSPAKSGYSGAHTVQRGAHFRFYAFQLRSMFRR